MTEPGAPDLLSVDVPLGGRVLVVSDLHLAHEATSTSTLAATELALTIAAWTGPGLLVFNGNFLELLPRSGPNGQSCTMADPRAALGAHPKLVTEVQAFAAGPGRRVLLLPGSRDGRAAWDPDVATTLRKLLGAEIALAAELRITTGAGLRVVRVEPGHRLDPLTRLSDPRNPGDSPLGQHLVCEVLPALAASGADRDPAPPAAAAAASREKAGAREVVGAREGWLSGLDDLDDPASFPRFLASRLTYRRLGRHVWLLALPVVAALVLRLPFAIVRRANDHVASASRVALFMVLASSVGLLLVGTVAAVVIRGTWRALAGVALSRDADRRDRNAAGRALARDLVTAGQAGLVTGHTRRPELTHLGCGFYANTGCACKVVSESPARLDALGMPSLFLARRVVSWIELEAGNELHVRVLHSRRDLPGASLIERLLTPRIPDERKTGSADEAPVVVASFPQGRSWPAPADVDRRLRRVRRLSSALVATAGVLSLLSAFLAPIRQRLSDLQQLVPLAVPQTANALVAMASLGLLALARSIRRGQRRAWLICEGLLVGTGVLHLVKGVDVEEAVVAAAVAGYLFLRRDAFRAGVDRPSTRQGLLTLAFGAAAAVTAGTLGIELGTMLSRSRHHQRFPLPRAFLAATERLLGFRSVTLPERLDEFVSPAMLAVAIGLVLAAAYLLSRPVVACRAATSGRRSRRGTVDPASGESLFRARGIMRRHGSGTLDYFALRSDKQLYFWGDGLVAYGVYGGVCLVSPDPIGPVAEREEIWKAFRRFADEHGWTLAVLGAGEQWLPIYRMAGMHDLYLGDEAVVDCTRFTMDGGRFKGLRQAVNRVAKYGYRITFHDPATIDAHLRAQLAAVMTKSRRGDVERGFSMTLGRAFDASDDGLLLAVVWGPRPPAAAPTPAGGTANGAANGAAPAPAAVAGGGTANGAAVAAGTGGMGNGAASAPAPAAAPGGPGISEPVAFCQYVPAPGINGFSLDLMRRDDGEHPNGLLDYAVVETIRYLKSHGYRGLGLNFATMRAVLAGELGEGISQRIQAWLLRRMSDSMQIESLWRFNAKYDPDWQPRYALYDSPEHALAALVAVARAESFWELPVIGRFLVPSTGPTTAQSTNGVESVLEPAEADATF